MRGSVPVNAFPATYSTRDLGAPIMLVGVVATLVASAILVAESGGLHSGFPAHGAATPDLIDHHIAADMTALQGGTVTSDSPERIDSPWSCAFAAPTV